jgi:hypothetical protein
MHLSGGRAPRWLVVGKNDTYLFALEAQPTESRREAK